MIKKVMATIMAATAIVPTANQALADDPTGNISGFYGQKNLDNNTAAYEDHREVGVIVNFKMPHWPVSVAVDFFVSVDSEDDVPGNNSDKVDISAVTTEYHIGLRKTWDIAETNISPYIGAGVALVNGYIEREVDGRDADSNDSDIGNWIGIGVSWRPVEHFIIGIDVRYSEANVKLFGEGLKAGGSHSGLFAGYYW